MDTILFLIVLFISNVLQTITGFAGTVLAMPPSMILLGMDNAKVVLSAMAWMSGLLITIQNYKNINKKELLKMSIIMLLGMIVGIQIYKFLPSDTLLTIYGVLVISIGVKNLIIKNDWTPNRIVLSIVLIGAGIIHGMFVSGGALLVVYAVSVLKNKDEFRATVAPIWIILNSYMMISYVIEDMVTRGNLFLIAISIVPLFIAIKLGNYLQSRIKQSTFLRLTYILLIISGAAILV
ncbi:MAG: sulfite exporter TauE/SafE family protein [Eubacteriales bacterium]